MFIDKYLSWDFHISNLSKKLSRAIGILSKLRYHAPQKGCLMVYNSIFHTHMVYGCNLWGLSTEKNIQKIEVLQKKCIRVLAFAPFNSHTNHLFSDLKILKIRDIIECQQLRVSYDYSTNRLPRDLMDLFSFRNEVQSTNLVLKSASDNLFYLPRTKSKTYGNKSIKYRCGEIWNKFEINGFLIPDLKSISDSKAIALHEIKNRIHLMKTLKKHFLYEYSLELES